MKKIIACIAILAVSLFGIASSVPAFAINCSDSTIPQTVRESAGCNTTNNDAFPKTIVNILNAVIGVSGLIAVIFVIIGGVNYMTSTGDAAKVKKAKDTILYATIGLAVCVLSFAIVNFVINNIINSDSPSNYTTEAECKKAGYTWDSKAKICK